METKQDASSLVSRYWVCNHAGRYGVFPGQSPSATTTMLSTGLLLQKNVDFLHLPCVPKNKFNQRSEKTQKQREMVKQDKIIVV